MTVRGVPARSGVKLAIARHKGRVGHPIGLGQFVAGTVDRTSVSVAPLVAIQAMLDLGGPCRFQPARQSARRRRASNQSPVHGSDDRPSPHIAPTAKEKRMDLSDVVSARGDRAGRREGREESVAAKQAETPS